MLRQLHSLPGLIAALLVVVIAVSGAILSLDPALERAGSTVPAAGQISVADLTQTLADTYPGAEQIERKPSGAIVVYYSDGDRVGADVVNPRTGQRIGAHEPSSFSRWVKNLHRSLLLDTAGRAAAGIVAVLMLVLTISGALLLAARLGGWRQMLRPIRGTPGQRLHGELGRAAFLALLLSALTGAYMSATTFDLIPAGSAAAPEFPAQVSGGPPRPVGELPALQATDLNDLRELVYPFADDPTDVYSLTTRTGAGFIDQASGEFLAWQAHSSARRFHQLIYSLHTGEGLWWLGLILGLAALAVPIMAVTGVLIWWRRRRAMPKFSANSAPNAAQTVILVGSENNSTWGFARTLHAALIQRGERVHTAPMNQLAAGYRRAERLLILTATYGDGGPPASASRFLARLDRFPEASSIPFAVLGFGDRQFPQFCGFATMVDEALAAKGWPRLLALDTVDRQSAQDFARWGDALGEAIGLELELEHTPARPRTTTLELVERSDYGADVQAPTAVLRFQAPARHGPAAGWLGKRHRLPRFEPGDLVGILPPGSNLARFYSLASAARDGMLEICVRKRPGGLCSGFLHALKIGDTIEAFIKPSPGFRPAAGKNPVILIGAGAGIAPLAGFIRHNAARRPMHLYWGGRSPQSDFLYEAELDGYRRDQRLTGLHAAFSRASERSYVQDKLVADRMHVREMIKQGAQILVCGGRDMASGVRQALNEVIESLGLDIATLQLEGRYREDVY